jgi:hypothetical protein
MNPKMYLDFEEAKTVFHISYLCCPQASFHISKAVLSWTFASLGEGAA